MTMITREILSPLLISRQDLLALQQLVVIIVERAPPYAYDGAADNISLVSALWEHHDHLEVYEDYIIDV